jgi:hypothetical protein
MQGEAQAVSSIRALARAMDGKILVEANLLISNFVPHKK